jgi:hypothetical protein
MKGPRLSSSGSCVRTCGADVRHSCSDESHKFKQECTASTVHSDAQYVNDCIDKGLDFRMQD